MNLLKPQTFLYLCSRSMIYKGLIKIMHQLMRLMKKKKKNPAKCANKGHPCLKILQEKYFDQKYLLALFQLQTEVFH